MKGVRTICDFEGPFASLLVVWIGEFVPHLHRRQLLILCHLKSWVLPQYRRRFE